MSEQNIRCPKCGSHDINRHWGDKLFKSGASLIGGMIEGYFGGSGETGGEIAEGIVEEIFQNYVCKKCGNNFSYEKTSNSYYVSGKKIDSFDPNIEKIIQGKLVTYSYKLYNDANGELLFETPKDAPEEMIYGVTPGIVPGLMAVMEGLTKGDKFEVTLPPVTAFGEKSYDLLMTLDKELFMRDGKLADEVKVGTVLPMMTADNLRVEGTVIEIGDKIKMDFNHPFAGLTVKYRGEIIDISQQKSERADSCRVHTRNELKEKGKDSNIEICTDEEKEYIEELKSIYSEQSEITVRERRLLSRLSKSLSISEERAKELENQVNPNTLSDKEQEYAEEIKACLEDDGVISDRERRILNRLATSLDITPERALEIEKFIISKK